MLNSRKGNAKKGFTLIELMIVVAIIGILAAVAIPKFAGLINKSKEGSTKGSLGAIRSALTVYYGDAEGRYPTDNLASIQPHYLTTLPNAKVPQLTGAAADSNAVSAASTAAYVTNAGGWAYANDYTESAWGTLVVNCTTTDSKGTLWTSY
ncbi:MAG: prepilin-type N-terminal cleavage/methylation domain-containing protein [Elusimicrobia bacterium]|nr:prepilin-type N-terminal cleavage/methylation domain-containing protein [Elusimicrobiota bacterium]